MEEERSLLIANYFAKSVDSKNMQQEEVELPLSCAQQSPSTISLSASFYVALN